MSAKRVICSLIWLVVSGCATAYRPVENTEVLHTKLSQELARNFSTFSRQIKIEILPMMNRSIAKPTLGIDPWDFQLFPIFMKVENFSQDPIKVNMVNSFVRVDEGQHWSVPVEVVLNRIGMYDVSASMGLGGLFGVLGGPAGAMVGAAAGMAMDESKVSSRTVEEHYHNQKFKPTILSPASNGSGVIFFDFPVDRVFSEDYSFFVEIVNLNGKGRSTVEIIVPVSHTRPLTEKEK